MRSILFTALAAAGLLTGPALASTAPFRLDSFGSCQEQRPAVAAMPGNGFVAVWQQGVEDDSPSRQRIFARPFGPGGTAPELELLVNGNEDGYSPAVAANAAGHVLVAWLDGAGKVKSRTYGPGAVLGPERTHSPSSMNGFAVTATNDGGFALVMVDSHTVFLARLNAAGQPQGLTQVLSSVTYPFPVRGYRDPVVAAYGPSGVVAAWAFEDLDLMDLGAVVVTSDGTVAGLDLGVLPQLIPEDELERSHVAVAANAGGQILVTWALHGLLGGGGALYARVFGADRQPVGPAVALIEPVVYLLSPPAAAADASGDFLVAWQLISLDPGKARGMLARVGPDGRLEGPAGQAWTAGSLERPALAVDTDGQAVVAWQKDATREGCFSTGLHARRVAFSPDVLLLREGRFEVRAHWTDHAGNTGRGQAVPLTGDSGSFWFFDDDNLELIVKVLDGREVNGHDWVFYGSLSDVAFTVEVTDTVGGQTKTYRNPAGQLASRADTAAFPQTAATAAAPIAPTAARSHVPRADGAGPCTPAELPVARRPGLCLGGRFEVEVAWHVPGGSGVGEGVRLTADTGYLYFFDYDNIELMVKVLDGREVNGRFWVFYGALTDVEHTLLVRDTVTGQVKTYHNPAGQLHSRADTAAF